MPGPDLTLLLDAAEAASRIARRHFGRAPETWQKDHGQGPVTEADLEIDRMLRGELLAARPDYGWLSEETEDSTDRLGHERVFIIDPIDGTRAFIDHQTTFSHSLAIAERGQVVAAAVVLPMRDLAFAAESGRGATLNGDPLSASTRETVEGARVLAARPQLSPELWPGGVPQVERHFRPSLAYRLSLVAEGRFDAMVTLRDAWEWDIAAGDLICREAGAVVTDRTGAALCFNNPHPQRPGVLAGAGSVHAGLIGHLQAG